MKLYKYAFGDWERYGPAVDDADAYERRVSVDPQFHYVPVVIEEVVIEGHEITVSPVSESIEGTPETSEPFVNYEKRDELVERQKERIKAMNKDEIKEVLKQYNVEFHHALGEEKLRELAIQHI